MASNLCRSGTGRRVAIASAMVALAGCDFSGSSLDFDASSCGSEVASIQWDAPLPAMPIRVLVGESIVVHATPLGLAGNVVSCTEGLFNQPVSVVSFTGSGALAIDKSAASCAGECLGFHLTSAAEATITANASGATPQTITFVGVDPATIDGLTFVAPSITMPPNDALPDETTAGSVAFLQLTTGGAEVLGSPSICTSTNASIGWGPAFIPPILVPPTGLATGTSGWVPVQTELTGTATVTCTIGTSSSSFEVVVK